MTGMRVLHVCVSAAKGTAKHAIAAARFVAGHGIEGDAHAGDGHRQVSLLAHDDIETMRAKGLVLQPGAFGENVVVDGISFDDLGVGSRLGIGESVELELSQVGKVCHTRCAIYATAGDCIMPRTGLFARVLAGGPVTPGLPVRVLQRVPRSAPQVALVTVSDRCAAGGATDTAGPAVADALRAGLGAHVAWTFLVPDERARIEHVLKDACDRRVDLVLTVGGTGCAARDVTPEATRAVIEREVPGLAEAMRAASSAVTPHALLSRAVAGIRRDTLVVNLPGSRAAALENLAAIAAALPHAVALLRGETTHVAADHGRVPGDAGERTHR